MAANLRIYNSLTKKKEKFVSSGKVGIYVCGVTPYDITHLGHAFTYVSFDLVVRYLEYLGNKVVYIQNVTDIDDDLLKRATRDKKNWRDLAQTNFAKFLEDMHWLNIRQPDFYPRASDHIPEIIEITKTLLEKGFAYEKNGNVYFSIAKFPAYGKLSRLSPEAMLPISRERGNNPDDPDKKNPLDFVLWQKQKEGEPFFPSPWGPGRPGWHIECSAMSGKYLGRTLDIHGGGGDLIYPHNESEIAQSESATGKEFARIFMHTAMLFYKGKKMSKSLGNMVFVKDLKQKYSANAVRLLLLSHHYRREWEYFEKEFEKINSLLSLFKKVWLKQSGSQNEISVQSYTQDFFFALNDDFNTPKAIRTLINLSNEIINNKNKKIVKAKYFLQTAFNILGLRIEY